ncbi:hypothetical protein [Pseudofrankia sp. BMG5.36]|nr:hypothetical protein [Pseudofrankia sp. BMG5.36]
MIVTRCLTGGYSGEQLLGGRGTELETATGSDGPVGHAIHPS